MIDYCHLGKDKREVLQCMQLAYCISSCYNDVNNKICISATGTSCGKYLLLILKVPYKLFPADLLQVSLSNNSWQIHTYPFLAIEAWSLKNEGELLIKPYHLLVFLKFKDNKDTIMSKVLTITYLFDDKCHRAYDHLGEAKNKLTLYFVKITVGNLDWLMKKGILQNKMVFHLERVA